jgi:uncharacterized protein (TIGR02444 family)
VAPACLALQDGHGRDVNLVLYGCWLGMNGRGAIGAAGLAAADQAIAAWRSDVIEPLRRVRRVLKGVAGAEALREAVKAVELDSERLCQSRLAALAPPPRAADRNARVAAAVANLTLYVGPEAAAPLVAALRIVKEFELPRGGLSSPPQRRTVRTSMSKRSSTRPSV